MGEAVSFSGPGPTLLTEQTGPQATSLPTPAQVVPEYLLSCSQDSPSLYCEVVTRPLSQTPLDVQPCLEAKSTGTESTTAALFAQWEWNRSMARLL